MAQKLILSAQTTQSLFNKRRTITAADAGKRYAFTVSGPGTIVPMKDKDGNAVLTDDGTPINKKIFNVNANSDVAVKNPRNEEILDGALTSEGEDDMDAADLAYRDWLNKTQVSFSIPDYKAGFDTIGQGDEIKARVQLVTTANGQILTLEEVTVAQVGIAAETKAVDFTARLEAIKLTMAATETPAQRNARLKAEADAAKAAKKAGKPA